MKTLFFLITFLFVQSFCAQNLKDFRVPKGYKKITEVKGDLDKDGKDETIIAYTSTIKEKAEVTHYKRVFYVLKNINDTPKVWKKNTSVLFPSNLGFYPENNELEIIVKNNTLIISQQFNTNSRHTLSYISTFRFQNNDFFLIGSVNRFDDTCEFNMLNEINFSTGKAIADQKYFSCNDDQEETPEKDFHKEFIYKLKTLPKMNNFTAGAYSFKIPNSDKYFNY